MEVLYQCCHATFAQALREHDVAQSAVEDRIGWQRERRVERFPQRRVRGRCRNADSWTSPRITPEWADLKSFRFAMVAGAKESSTRSFPGPLGGVWCMHWLKRDRAEPR